MVDVMLSRVDEGAGDPPATRAEAAAARLLAHRHAQRGRPTLGDELDLGLVDALRDLAAPHAPALRPMGERLGRDVYAKRVVDAPLEGAIAALAEDLHASGLARLRLEGAFHRTAVLRLVPVAPAGAPLLEGLVHGFLGECYNCDVALDARSDGTLVATLGPGRDVNRRSPR